MNKKILAGSIIAIVLLIGISFTSVVGYRRVESDVKSSPLFTFRTSRAVDKEIKVLKCDYVGKGITFTIPKRDSKTALILKFIVRINTMDDITFQRFLNLIINQMNDEHEDSKKNEVITTIYQLKNNPEIIISDYSEKSNWITWLGNFFLTFCWFPGCIILVYIWALFNQLL